MKIIDISGEYTASSIDEVETILQRREEPGGNAFWLSHDEEDYPMLSVLVKADIAALDFLERDDEPGFRSVGNLPNVNRNENTVFSISRNRADDLEVQNDALISFPDALAAAKEFLDSGKRPQCIDWFEL